jgi:hypothetical protein
MSNVITFPGSEPASKPAAPRLAAPIDERGSLAPLYEREPVGKRWIHARMPTLTPDQLARCRKILAAHSENGPVRDVTVDELLAALSCSPHQSRPETTR